MREHHPLSHCVTGQGPGPEWVCPGPAVECRSLTSCRKDFTARVLATMKIHLLKLGTVKQGRAGHRRSNRRAQAGLPLAYWEYREKGALGTGSGDHLGKSASCLLP